MAQRSAFLNFGNLIAAMPETKMADAELEAYRKQLVATGEKMMVEINEAYHTLLNDVQAGIIPPNQQQQRQEELQQQQQQQISNYEKEISQKVELKREELLKPIQERIENAVRDVAREKRVACVFDTSVFNAVLYADKSFDMEPLVRARLGLPGSGGNSLIDGTASIVFVNSTEILSRLPLIKQADSQLQTFQTQLQQKGESMAAELEQEYLSFLQRVERGELSSEQQYLEKAKIEAKQSRLGEFEQDRVKQIADKRTELLQPIYNQVNAAIAAAAKKTNIQMVFERSILLYFDESVDLSDLVGEQLGLPASRVGTFRGGASAYGAVNPTAILASMPDVEQADFQINVLVKELQKRGQDMVDQFQQDYRAVMQKVERGELSPAKQEEESARLDAKQSEIISFEQQMTNQLQDARNKLYEPIFKRVNEAVANVAKEQNLSMVFEMGALLYSDPALDISALVKRKLGI
ncbi:OmpH family outer membrane protein [Mariniradius saccharolyticus]|nr:OmpH family outer membrane protein [Mariniradius saccharolyticus]